MTTTQTPIPILHDPRRVLVLITLVLAVAELADAFFVSFPEGPAVFAALLLVGAFWIRRGGIGGPIFVAALFAFDLANSPAWPRHTTMDWATAIAYAAVSLAGLLTAVAVTKQTFQTRKTSAVATQTQA